MIHLKIFSQKNQDAENFMKFFQTKSLLQTVKSIKFSLFNNKNAIVSGNEG